MGLIHLLLLSLLLTSVAPHEEVNLQGSCSSKSTGNIHNLSTNAIRLTLHHPRDPCSPSPLPPLPFSIEQDNRRVEALSRRITRGISGSKASSPIFSGIPLGTSSYIARIGLGNPSKFYDMVIDTANALFWLQCSPCIFCQQQAGPLFDPKASKSYSTIACSTAECDLLNIPNGVPPSCTSANVCVYHYTYADETFTNGDLSRDTVSVGSLSIPSFIFGCGKNNGGLFGRSAGIIGLSKAKLSLISQAAAKVGSTAFSHCFPSTPSGTGYLSLGPYDASKFSYTPMVTNPLEDTLYFVKLSGITVGGKPIAATPSAYSRQPTIFDSGTTITRLPPDIYLALRNSLSAALRNYAKATNPEYDTCFVGSASNIVMPEVSLVFAGGATMKLPARNVLIDVGNSTTCMAFATLDVVTIIGSHQQQTFDMVYDLKKAVIGFAAGGCH